MVKNCRKGKKHFMDQSDIFYILSFYRNSIGVSVGAENNNLYERMSLEDPYFNDIFNPQLNFVQDPYSFDQRETFENQLMEFCKKGIYAIEYFIGFHPHQFFFCDHWFIFKKWVNEYDSLRVPHGNLNLNQMNNYFSVLGQIAGNLEYLHFEILDLIRIFQIRMIDDFELELHKYDAYIFQISRILVESVNFLNTLPANTLNIGFLLEDISE